MIKAIDYPVTGKPRVFGGTAFSKCQTCNKYFKFWATPEHPIELGYIWWGESTGELLYTAEGV